jgi:hypothetical protein
MKKTIAIIIALITLLLCVNALALNRVTTSALNIRATPSLKGTIVATVKRGTSLSVASCGPTWCQVSYQGRLRYAVRVRLLAPSARPLSRPNGKGYTNIDGNHILSPVFAPSAPAGASALCADGTYSFSAHRRGTCSRKISYQWKTGNS